MLDLSHITYIGIQGRKDSSEKTELMCKVAEKISNEIKFHEIILLSACQPTQNYKNIKLIPISPLTYEEYQVLEFKFLGNWIKSDFLLTFHDDGFAVNPQNWKKNFCNYDYVGAPWRHDTGWSPIGREVGNGGFSLRSKKLYEKTKYLKLPNKMHSDGAVCCFYRDFLIDGGIKFADLKAGYDFSIEAPFDENHKLENTFGFHASRHLKLAHEILFETKS